MRKLSIAVLLALAAALPLVAKNKPLKDKRFDPVVISRPAEAEGRYVGIDPDFVIELRAGGGTVRNFARTARLTHVVIEGSELKATAIYADGRREPLQATFVRRTKNGEIAFGMLLRNFDVRIEEDVTIQNLFCLRQ